MTNKTEDKKLEQVENYVKSQDDETNNQWKISKKQINKSDDKWNTQRMGLKWRIFIIITLIAPFVLPYILDPFAIERDYLDIDGYILLLGVVICIESFFIYFIKKIIPKINLVYIRAFLLLIILYFYQTADWWGQLGIIFLLILTPLIWAISYFGSHLITAIILAIQRTIRKEKVYDNEMKKICIWLWIGLLIVFILLTIYFWFIFK